MKHLEQLKRLISPDVHSIIWASNSPLTDAPIFAKELDYFFDGIVLKKEESATHATTKIFFTTSFDHKVALVFIEKNGQNFKKELVDQVKFLKVCFQNDKRKKVLLINIDDEKIEALIKTESEFELVHFEK